MFTNVVALRALANRMAEELGLERNERSSGWRGEDGDSFLYAGVYANPPKVTYTHGSQWMMLWYQPAESGPELCASVDSVRFWADCPSDVEAISRATGGQLHDALIRGTALFARLRDIENVKPQ